MMANESVDPLRGTAEPNSSRQLLARKTIEGEHKPLIPGASLTFNLFPLNMLLLSDLPATPNPSLPRVS